MDTISDAHIDSLASPAERARLIEAGTQLRFLADRMTAIYNDVLDTYTEVELRVMRADDADDATMPDDGTALNERSRYRQKATGLDAVFTPCYELLQHLHGIQLVP